MIAVSIFVLRLLELKNCIFKMYVCLNAALERKVLYRFPPNSQQTYNLGHFRCTQTPAYNVQEG